jgi:hypothetical protein
MVSHRDLGGEERNKTSVNGSDLGTAAAAVWEENRGL